MACLDAMEDFDKELDEEYNLLLKSEKEADEQIISIEKKIKRYTLAGWLFVWAGMVFFILEFLVYFFVNIDMKNLNLLGDFYGGSVASLWSLAALLFIFVAFLPS